MMTDLNQIKYLGIITEKRKQSCEWKCMADFYFTNLVLMLLNFRKLL